MPTLRCPHCSASLKAPETVLGKSVRCPRCGQTFLATAPASPSDDPFDLAPSDPLSAPVAPLAGAPREASASRPFAPVPTAAGASGVAKTSKKGEDRPPWLIPGLIGCGALLLFGLLVTVVAFVGVAVVATSSGGALENIGRPSGTVDLAREPEAGEYSPQPRAMPQDADAAVWKVTVDGVAPASGLQSVIVLPARMEQGTFALSGASAKAAVVVPRPDTGVTWTRYDLTRREPIGDVVLRDDVQVSSYRAEFRSAISPSGNRITMLSPFISKHEPAQVPTFDVSGKELAAANFERPAEEVQWLALPSDTRLLALVGGTLYGYDVNTGEKKYEIAGFRDLPRLSPGGKFAAGLTGEGIVWISCDDGSRSGLSPLPAAWFEPAKKRNPSAYYADKRIGRVSFHPEGKRAALLVVDVHGDLHVTLIDVATGKVEDCFVATGPNANTDLGLDAVWPNDRQMLLSTGHLLDIDARTWVAEYELDYPLLVTAPDGRYWRVYTVPWARLEELAPKLGLPTEGGGGSPLSSPRRRFRIRGPPRKSPRRKPKGSFGIRACRCDWRRPGCFPRKRRRRRSKPSRPPSPRKAIASIPTPSMRSA